MSLNTFYYEYLTVRILLKKSSSFIKCSDQMSPLNLTSVLWRGKGLVPVVINNKTQYNTGEGRQTRKKKCKQRKIHPAKQK